MADGKVVIETDLDSSGIEKGLSKLGSITAKGMKAATVAITWNGSSTWRSRSSGNQGGF